MTGEAKNTVVYDSRGNSSQMISLGTSGICAGGHIWVWSGSTPIPDGTPCQCGLTKYESVQTQIDKLKAEVEYWKNKVQENDASLLATEISRSRREL